MMCATMWSCVSASPVACRSWTTPGPEERHPVGGGAAAVLRDRWPDRELPDRHIPGLCLASWACVDRPVVVSARAVDRRSGAMPAGRYPGRDRVETKPRQAMAMLARALAARPPLALGSERGRLLRLLRDPAARPCWIWPGSPGPAGGSRNASSRPRTKPGSTTARSGPGARGMPTSPCRCWPTPGSPCPDPCLTKGNRCRRTRHDRIHATGEPPPDHQTRPACHRRRRARLGVVILPPPTTTPSPPRPQQTRRLPTHLTAVTVLGCR